MSRKKGHNAFFEMENVGYWQSYSDMMASLLMVFILLAAIVLVCLTVVQKQLKDTEQELAAAQEQQGDQNLQGTIEELNNQILGLQDQIDSVNQTISDMQEHTDRTAIAAALLQEFAGYGALVDKDTGDVTLEQDITFEQDGNQLTQQGRACLDEVLPKYIRILMSEEYKDQLSQVIIEGHTSSEGRYMYNLNLGQERAYAVANYFLNEDNGNPFEKISDEMLDAFRPYVSVNSRSESELIYDEYGIEDEAASRRVVIKYRLKSDDAVEQLGELSDQMTELREKAEATKTLIEKMWENIDNPQ